MATSQLSRAKGKNAGPATKGLEVIAKRPQFYRGGQAFNQEPRVVALADLTEEQAEQIRAEGQPGGMLIVREVDIEAAEKAA